MTSAILGIEKGTTNASATFPGANIGIFELLSDGTLQFVFESSSTIYKLSPGMPFVPGGRLSLTTNVPITPSDVTAAGTLYYIPFAHGGIRIFNGSYWIPYTFTERSLSLTLTSGKNYDVFIYDNSGTLTLELSAAWTNDSTRADALARQNGVVVKSGSTTRLWLGTIRASGANTTEDSKAKRFVWNAYNTRERELENKETTTTWSYATDSWRKTRDPPPAGFLLPIAYGEVW